MLPFHTILVAADFSESSREAFHVACTLAATEEARFIVLHVVVPPIIYGEIGVPTPRPDEDRTHREAMRGLLHEDYSSDRPMRIEYWVRDGLAAEEILCASAEVGADLIVLGTHGRTGLRRLLTGSVAEAVLRGARCPVLMLKSQVNVDAVVDNDETKHDVIVF